jgi:hypothetical protein
LHTGGASSDAAVAFSGKNNYWGLGPRAGIDGQMDLCHGFSVIGKIASALLYGKTETKSLINHVVSGAIAQTVDSSFSDDFYQLSPNLQLVFGFQWQTCFWCEKLLYKMSASWEANYWWNQFNVPVATTWDPSVQTGPLPSVGNQPLTMEGLTLNFELDF